ncbi:MAG: hypothetical protein H6959_08040 [Chromatiaceae bacterium]|nr:hypothetical protein [Gammaproteobacteria bacterium]MCP5300784.1 hypothetical protein [Chromatiaceae bacterium]MCP5422856.1 hypothetical protein [Chromatiaceae bacterium]
MRALIKLLLLLLLLALLLLAGLTYLATSTAPLVTQQVTLSHEDIAHARSILRRYDPRRHQAGTTQTVQIAPEDINLAANYLLQKVIDGKIRMTLAEHLLRINATLRFDRLPLRPFINIDGAIASEGGQPRITRLQIGRLHVPDVVANAATRWLVDELARRTGRRADTGFIEDLQLTPEGLQLRYRWDWTLIEHARETLLGSVERDALRFYHDALVRVEAEGLDRRGSIVTLLQAMFRIAEQRSQTGDPVAENTALLTVLGTWAGRQDLRKLVPGRIPRPHVFVMMLQRRVDFAQHFLASAALAARGDTTLSDAVGLFKEISDTDGGSGFSFTDIAADRAGTRFGALVTGSDDAARRAQQRIAAGIAEQQIMPAVHDLPEHMHGDEFRRRFSRVGSPEYQAMMREIEHRIDACDFYQD